MPKVYVLYYTHGEDEKILGIYSTKAKVEDIRQKQILECNTKNTDASNYIKIKEVIMNTDVNVSDISILCDIIERENNIDNAIKAFIR